MSACVLWIGREHFGYIALALSDAPPQRRRKQEAMSYPARSGALRFVPFRVGWTIAPRLTRPWPVRCG
jgi:hypothetical protein